MTLRRRGYTLLLAVVLIGAVGVTIGLMARHVVAQTRWVRRAVLDIQAAQMISDGQIWVATHPADCRRTDATPSPSPVIRGLPCLDELS